MQYLPRCPVAARRSNTSATSCVASPLPYASVVDFNVLRYASYAGFNQTVYLRFPIGSRGDEKATGWHRGAHIRARGAAAAVPRRGGVPRRLTARAPPFPQKRPSCGRRSRRSATCRSSTATSTQNILPHTYSRIEVGGICWRAQVSDGGGEEVVQMTTTVYVHYMLVDKNSCEHNR